MAKQYDFLIARRGAVIVPTTAEARITSRRDDGILDGFKGQVERAGGVHDPSLNLRRWSITCDGTSSRCKKTLRRVLREQLRKAAMLCRSAALVSPAGTL